jgi:endonuclease III
MPARKPAARTTASSAGKSARAKKTVTPKASALPRMTTAEIEAFFAELAARDAAPTSELNWSNPYTLVVAVALSAQATDVGVNKATGPLFAIADTPEKMLALGEDRLRDYIKTIGLYKTKAKNVIGLSRLLVERYGSEVPQTREELQELPGVGRKTANVVLNVAFGQPTIAVDTHIFRVGNRTGMAPGKTPDHVEAELEKVVPAQWRLHAHHWLILHGRYICKARRPNCPICPVRSFCHFTEKTELAA